MAQGIKLIVKKGKLNWGATRPISIQYCFSATKRTCPTTGFHIPPQFWDKRSSRISNNLPLEYLPKEFASVDEFQDKLDLLVRKAEDMVKTARRRNVNPLIFLRNNFAVIDKWEVTQMTDERPELDVYKNLRVYVENRRSQVVKSTIGIINMMGEHLKAYETFVRNVQPDFQLTFDLFDFNFYASFVKFLTYDYQLRRKAKIVKGLRVNSIGKTIKWLKAFLKNCMDRKVIKAFDLDCFKTMEEEVDAVYCSWKEIATMYNLDLSAEPLMEAVRDEFVLGCLTGFRFSDYSTVVPDEVRDGMLFVTTTKTGERVVVPLRPEAKAVLEKYGMRMPQISNPVFNAMIKEVARRAGLTDLIKFTYNRGNQKIEEIKPKWQWIMSHTCRRSFCTNEFLDETPITLIMGISGHRSEKAFRRYIRADNLEKAMLLKKKWGDRAPLTTKR